MSTFNGFVKEFPNIRIDHFRMHPGRPPPAACFLSHVHSDHLQGLESLKMPFVYCSSATRRLLLRIEKYPHRNNFAKGILESRKQHYRHLKSVLRALPLQTATELELDPKSKIRVTLFDGNHCPGAVAFLIESDAHAILYTGDIRSEPWWVNSLVQNPYLLPYVCGQKRLDCIYLDTTFASGEGDYKTFPTKAEGLKELLQKAVSFPDDTTFYFRAWTLGYENVWIALSNLLRSRVHVDDYQLRLFTSLAENGRDGYSMFEGPSLAGFPVGHHDHPGCLTHDTNARIHSCEPGTACHAELAKRNNVVWITPIISRLEDGTEIREIGAGGGLGDLYQIPEIELNEAASLQAFEQVCADLFEDTESLVQFRQSIVNAQKSGNRMVSLRGLELETETEISLKDFFRLVSRKSKCDHLQDASLNPTVQNPEVEGQARTRVIHFPYSRHSSYDELRHLVSVFRPKDICACTIDLQSWSEDVSMQALFGDLCSEEIYLHDQEVRLEVEELKKTQALENRLKRKRDDDSQRKDEDSQEDYEGEETFKSAPASLKRTSDSDRQLAASPGKRNCSAETSCLSQRPLIPPRESDRETRAAATHFVIEQTNLYAVREAFHNINNGAGIITTEDESQPVQDEDSQISLNLSTFESQSKGGPEDTAPIDDGDDGLQTIVAMSDKSAVRAAARREAYKAATRSLRERENGEWNDLGLRSLNRGHIDVELEL